MASEASAGHAVIDCPSPNQDKRPCDSGPIDTLVLHYTGMTSASAALKRMVDPVAKVSAHWCIGEQGTIWRLVSEEYRAWHAGSSYWRGRPSVNDFSIGIELVNPGHEFGYRPFPRAQMEALLALSACIMSRHPIVARNVVAHSDIAPLRRKDPGELFDWRHLSCAGVGFWPKVGAMKFEEKWTLRLGDHSNEVHEYQSRLCTIGYDLVADGNFGSVTKAVVEAFQRHYRQTLVDGIVDRGTAALVDYLFVSMD